MFIKNLNEAKKLQSFTIQYRERLKFFSFNRYILYVKYGRRRQTMKNGCETEYGSGLSI